MAGDYSWTPYVAAYAAAVATATFIWNTVRDFQDRRQKIDVNVTAVSDGEAWIRVTNHSAQRQVQVTGITAYAAGGFGRCCDWSRELPTWLTPGEYADSDIPKEIDFLRGIVTVEVTDGRGRTYFAPRKAVSKARETLATYHERWNGAAEWAVLFHDDEHLRFRELHRLQVGA
jgi:hypothetical protein